MGGWGGVGYSQPASPPHGSGTDPHTPCPTPPGCYGLALLENGCAHGLCSHHASRAAVPGGARRFRLLTPSLGELPRLVGAGPLPCRHGDAIPAGERALKQALRKRCCETRHPPPSPTHLCHHPPGPVRHPHLPLPLPHPRPRGAGSAGGGPALPGGVRRRRPPAAGVARGGAVRAHGRAVPGLVPAARVVARWRRAACDLLPEGGGVRVCSGDERQGGGGAGGGRARGGGGGSGMGSGSGGGVARVRAGAGCVGGHRGGGGGGGALRI